MAVVLDGHSLKGNWKIYDDGSPNDYYQIPKGEVYFYSIDATSGTFHLLGDFTKTNPIGGLTTGADTVDENGNALNTSAKIAEYLSNNR